MAEDKKRGRGRPPRSDTRRRRRVRQLDRKSGVPLYFQLGAALREIVLSGDWPPGSQFLTEREICAEFEVSRTVTRRALNLLVSDGRIELKRGSGAFVTAPRRSLRPLGLMKALMETPEGLEIKTRMSRDERAKKAIAKILDLPAGGRVAHITALLMFDEEPVCLLDSYCRLDLAPWLIPAVRSLGRDDGTVLPTSLVLGETEVEIELSFFSAWGGPQMGATPGAPTLIGQLVQLGRPAKGRKEVRLEFAHLIFRPDRVQLEF